MPTMNEFLEKALKGLNEDRHRSMWADTATKDGKKGKLIGYWQDLNSYYDFDGITWSYSSNRKWSNQGKTDDFKKNLKAGKWRGKLLESINEASHPALIEIADMFARYLIGDKDIAVSQMKKEGQFQTRGLANMSSSEYNKFYAKLHSDIFQVLRNDLKNLM